MWSTRLRGRSLLRYLQSITSRSLCHDIPTSPLMGSPASVNWVTVLLLLIRCCLALQLMKCTCSTLPVMTGLCLTRKHTIKYHVTTKSVVKAILLSQAAHTAVSNREHLVIIISDSTTWKVPPWRKLDYHWPVINVEGKSWVPNFLIEALWLCVRPLELQQRLDAVSSSYTIPLVP